MKKLQAFSSPDAPEKHTKMFGVTSAQHVAQPADEHRNPVWLLLSENYYCRAKNKIK